MDIKNLVNNAQIDIQAKMLVFACGRLGLNPNTDEINMSELEACMTDTFGSVVREHYITHYRWDIIQPYMLLNKSLFSNCSASAIIECIRQYLIYVQVVENKF